MKILVICFFVLFVMNANGQPLQHNGYTVTGAIKGIDSGMVRMFSADENVVLDSAVITKGKFSMQGKITTPQRLRFSISPGNWNFRAFIENAVISLAIDTAGAQHYGKDDNTWALIWEIKETGSELSDVYARFKKETNEKYYKSIVSSLREKLKSVNGDKVMSSEINLKIDSVVRIALKNQKKWVENYINENSSSVAAVFLFNDYYQSLNEQSLPYLDSILNKFSGLAKTSFYYNKLVEQANNLKHIQNGSKVPDFFLLQKDKTPFRLSVSKGNYTLIDFWASWCAPCRKAIPNWKKVYEKYHQRGLNIVSVSDDRNWDDWIKALEKEQMPWVQVIDEFPDEHKSSRVSELYGVKYIPFYVLLDTEKKVILASGEENEAVNKIKELFE